MGDNDLVMSNQGFVYLMATRYASSGVAFDDLVNAGFLGLLKAAKRFDEGRGVKFITFATSWIQHEMIKVIRETRFPCVIPLNLNKVVNQMRRGTEGVEGESTFPDLIPLLKHPVDSSDTSEIFTVNFSEEVVNRLAVEQALQSLDDRTQKMIRMFFGIKTHEPKNITEIAREFGLSKQRVFNLIRTGLEKMRKCLK